MNAATLEPIRGILALAGDIASITGLLVTIAVAVTIRRLRAFYVFKARVPQLISRIAEKASSVSNRAADFINTRDEIGLDIKQIGILIESLAAKSSGPAKTASRQLAKRLKGAHVRSRPDVTDLYAEIQTLLARYDELQRDLEWER